MSEIGEMVDALTRMLDAIKVRVDGLHKVEPGSVTADRILGNGDEVTVNVPCFFHRERGQTLQVFAYGSNADLYAKQNEDRSYGNAETARDAAERARNLGVQAEIRYLQVPEFEAVRDQWRRFSDDQMVAAAMRFANTHRIPDIRRPLS